MAEKKTVTVAVAGNPNCGKSTMFNLMTGSTQKVGNWPGVTVEKRVGQYDFDGRTWDLVDLPGVYMIGSAGAGSQDEKVARDYILSGEADVVLDIIDASNLERNLYLTTQLLELGAPLVVVLNMVDLARGAGIEIDAAALGRRLGCPVVTMIASRGIGRDELRRAIAEIAASGSRPTVRPKQDPAIEAAVGSLAASLADAAKARGADPRWVALKLIEGDTFAERVAAGRLDAEVAAARQRIETATGEDADIVIADGRYTFIGTLMAECHHHTQRLSASVSQIIDAVVLNRWLGVPVFLVAMYAMFLFTIKVGGAFIDFFDQSFGAIFVDGLGQALAAIGTPPLLLTVATGFGSGLQTVSTFVPIIACLFLFLSFLEDSGYMARAAFVMDRAMRAIGLPGKSFVPLIVGFGCNVPSIMATRTLESRRDRVMTVLMAPFMSCGARLPVFALFAAAFFPASGQNVVFGLYIIGLAVAVLTGLVLKSTLLTGEATYFVMELPPYHIPTLHSVVYQAWQRLKEFIRKAGMVIVPIVMALSFLSQVGPDGTVGVENSRSSALAVMSQKLIPVMEPLGVNRDNWPAAVGLFTGVFAKEAVVGTLNGLYAQEAADASVPTAKAPEGIGSKLVGALKTIPDNFAALGASITDPLGINVGYTDDKAAAAEALEVDSTVFTAMHEHFGSSAAAFAYMLLILLYTPCVAALGAMRHEVGGKWTGFAVAWTTGLGYVIAVAFYQTATFAAHPASSANWLIGCAIAFVAAVAAMWMAGRQRARSMLAQPAE